MTGLLSLSQTQAAWLTLIVVGLMFLMFLREVFPTEVVAMAGAAVLLVQHDPAASGLCQLARRKIRPIYDNGVDKTDGALVMKIRLQFCHSKTARRSQHHVPVQTAA